MPNDYSHTPLEFDDSIRLLHVRRSTSKFGKDVIFNLSHVRLSDDPAYEAMSYAWKNPVKSKILTCLKTGAQLRVTESCFSALYDLCAAESRVIWVDAVCINQHDVEERNKQVAMMARICMQASRTVIYIGKLDKISPNTIRFLQQSFYDAFDEVDGFNEGDALWKRVIKRAIPKPFDAMSRFERKVLPQIANLLQRPWFNRTWIIQEVLLSDKNRTVAYVGQHEFEWWHFYRWSSSLNEDDPPQTRVPGMLKLLKSFDKQIESPPRPFLDFEQLFEVLRDTSDHQCTDSRDKLFALLSLFKGATPKGLEADYRRSLQEVYANTSGFLML